MPAATFVKGHGIDLLVQNRGHGVALAVQATGASAPTRGHSVSVFLYDEEQVTRRLVISPKLSERISDQLIGLAEVDDVGLEIENIDGALTFLQTTEVRGTVCRILRLDEDEFREVFTGTIDELPEVGDSVKINLTNHDLDVLTTQLPRHRVLDVGELPEDATVQDLTVDFPGAPDQNSPINTVFGRVPHVPLRYVFADPATSTYRYLVCEDTNVDVDALEKDGQPAFVETGVHTDLSTNFMQFPTSTPDRTAAFYVGLVVRFTRGASRGLEREITGYDPITRYITWDEPLPVVTLSGGRFEIREYLTLRNSPYVGRTAIQFRFRQDDPSGGLKALTATVARYRPVRKNRLQLTDVPQDAELWSFTGFSLSTTSLVPGPDGLPNTAMRISTGQATLKQTTPVTTPAANEPWTFSCWLRCDTPQTCRLQIQRIAGADPTALDVDVTSTWQRFSVTKTAWGASGPAEVVVRGPAGSIPMEVANLQFEPGLVPTYYEPVVLYGQGALWSFPDAIRELLEDSFVFLGQPVTPASFEAANETLDGLFLRCHGVLPYLDDEPATAQDVLNELLGTRGFLLRKAAGGWTLQVDAPGRVPLLTVGTGETPWPQMKTLGPVRKLPISQVVKTLVLDYDQRRSPTTGEIVFPRRLKFPVLTVGKEERRRAHFIRDERTATYTGTYQAAVLRLQDQELTATIGQVGRNLLAGDVIEVIAPRRQPENRLVYSEESWRSPWTGGTTKRPTLAPDTLSTRGQWHVAGEVVSQVGTTIPMQGQQVYISAWLRTWAQSVTIPIRTLVGASVWKEEAVHVGMGWQRYQVQTTLPLDGLQRQPGVRFAVPTGVTLGNYGWQLTVDYPFPYIRTQATAIPALTVWRVTRSQRSIGEMALTIAPWDEAALFTAPTFATPEDLLDTPDADPRLLLPDPPTDITVPPNPAPGVVTANAGADVASDGAGDSWARISFLMPTRAAVRVEVQIRKKSDNFWHTKGFISTSEVALGQRATVLIRGLTPGLLYEVRAIASNAVGKTAASILNPEFVAWGDLIAPPPPTAIALARGTGRNIQIDVGLPAVTQDLVGGGGEVTVIQKRVDDLAYINLYRTTGTGNPNTNPAFASTLTLIDRSAKTQFHDVNVSPDGLTRYYYARAEDYSGNMSPYFPNGNGAGIKPSHLGAGDSFVIQDGVVLSRVYFATPAGVTTAMWWNGGSNNELFTAVGQGQLFFMGPDVFAGSLNNNLGYWDLIEFSCGATPGITVDNSRFRLQRGADGVLTGPTAPHAIWETESLRFEGEVIKVGSSLGSVQRALRVRDPDGTLRGWIPIYNTFS